MDYTDIA
jgi:diketogulonate reductase-like aldo/keto reductase